MTNTPFDESEFLITGPLWFLVPNNASGERGEFCKCLVRAKFLRWDGTWGQHVVVFTDSDLARRFVDALGERGAVLRRMACQTPEDEIQLVEKLLELGDTHLGEAARAFGVSLRTADRLWAFALVWLLREIGGDLCFCCPLRRLATVGKGREQAKGGRETEL
jgi:hypothetical protein